MDKKSFLIAVMIGISILFAGTGIYASNKVVDVIRLENKAYADHKEGIVIFQHRKHQKEYREKNPGLFTSACGECHHDKDNKPLVNLREGDDVHNCIECHKKPGYVKGNEAKGLSKKQRREYHANAMHDNCKACHKKSNKKKGLKSKDKGYAPISCRSCHQEKKT